MLHSHPPYVAICLLSWALVSCSESQDPAAVAVTPSMASSSLEPPALTSVEKEAIERKLEVELLEHLKTTESSGPLAIDARRASLTNYLETKYPRVVSVKSGKLTAASSRFKVTVVRAGAPVAKVVFRAAELILAVDAVVEACDVFDSCAKAHDEFSRRLFALLESDDDSDSSATSKNADLDVRMVSISSGDSTIEFQPLD